MDNYIKKIKRRIPMLAVVALAAAGFGVYDVFFASEALKETHMFNFQAGLITALGVMAVVFIIKYSRMLKDERKLSLEYNKENDERLKAIRAKAGVPLILITSMLMIVAGIVAGYKNETVFFTLVAAAAAQMTVSAAIKVINLKRM